MTKWRPIDPAIRARVAMLMRDTKRPIIDIAGETGVSRRTIHDWNRRFGWRHGAATALDARALDPQALRALLYGHIARQIAWFDAALRDAAVTQDRTLDSAKVLRDLGGLKRLLDEADDERRAEGARDGAHDTGAERASPEPDDLPALRAQIAQRFAALGDERADAGCAGDAAAAADPGAGR